MSLGITALATNQKRELSGAPFDLGSAFNGASVDAATGKVVLGNNQGDPSAPAQLINQREIEVNAFSLMLVKQITGALAAYSANFLTFHDGIGSLTEIFTDNFGSTLAQGIATLAQSCVHSLTGSNGEANRLSADHNAPMHRINVGSNAFHQVEVQTTCQRTFGDAGDSFLEEMVPGGTVQYIHQATGNGFNIDPVANSFLLSGEIQTGDPGSGRGNWKLGSLIAAASVVDPNNYVEISIGGAVVKLAVIV